MLENCTGLTSLIIPQKVTVIGRSAFSGCTSLREIEFPDGLTTIYDHAFQNCTGLTELNLPGTVTHLGYYALQGCSGITSFVVPKNLAVYGDDYDGSAFAGSSITSIVIEDGVTTIPAGAFYKCSQLKNVVIPDSVTSINYRAFMGCSTLEVLYITGEVSSIGASAFQNCSKLSSFYFCGDAPVSVGSNAFSGLPADSTIYYADNTSGWDADLWSSYNCLPFDPSEIEQAPIYINIKLGETYHFTGGFVQLIGKLKEIDVDITDMSTMDTLQYYNDDIDTNFFV